MSAAMDVAYLDVPYVAHVPRNAVLLRMNPACWEDACHDCPGIRCICACHDQPPLRALPAAATRRCRTCGYLIRSESHRITCAAVMDRVDRLAEAIARRAA